MNLLLVHLESQVHPVTDMGGPSPETTSRSDLVKKVLELYERLKDKMDHSERVCQSLRKASKIKVFHGSGLTNGAAKDHYQKFFENQSRKHFRWLWIDAVLAAFGSLLVFVPGPNVFFFYPAARSVGHYLARKGARRALKMPNICFKNEPLIDQIEVDLDNLDSLSEEISKLESKLGIRNITSQFKHMRKHESRS